MEARNLQDFNVRKRLIDVSVYHRMMETGILSEQDRVELIHGEIVEMSPVNSQHASHVKKIAAFLFSNAHDQYQLGVQDPVALGDLSQPEPDLSILRSSEDYYQKSHPSPKDILLLIEVADTSLAYDRQIKAPLYAAAGIARYWIVNLTDRCVEVYEQPKQQQYSVRRLFYAGDSIPVPFSQTDIPVNELFV